MPRQSKVPKPSVSLLWITLAVGSASLIAVGQPDASHHPSRTEPDADFDGDGIVNALDNCLVGSNPDQRDSDRDGVGNACDADFNNDGIVDERDRVALTHAFGTNARDKDLNGDGVVDWNDLRILNDLVEKAPGPRLDSDGDGVADLQDPCPGPSPGILSTVPGCTALALLQKPDAVLGPFRSYVRRIAEDLQEAAEMLEVRLDVGIAADDVGGAERLIRRGAVCESNGLFMHVDETLERAFHSIERQLADAREADRGVPGEIFDDVSEADMLVAWLEYWEEQVTSLRTWNRANTGAFAGICAAAQPGMTRGIIETIDDAQRRIVLTDGRTFGLTHPVTLTDDIYPGRAVEIGGLILDDGNGHATTVKHDGAAPDVTPAPFVHCTVLRFAPVQRFPPVFSGPFTLHDPLAYKTESVYEVEAGMAVAAEAKCPHDRGGRSFPRYTLKVQISYQQDVTGAAIDHASMAEELTPGDDPVPFPDDVYAFAPATLHVTSEMRSCTKVQSMELCADPTPIGATDYPLAVRWRDTLAHVEYDQKRFDVNDQKSGDFRFAHVQSFNVFANLDANTSPTFVAEGFGPFFDGIVEGPIVNGDPFAIRNVDFFPIFPAVTPLGKLLEMGATSLSGVDHAAGLRWPRVQGIRNGREFWYSASLPRGIVRDVVNFCSAQNAYYRLPFVENFIFLQGQGNHPELPTGSGPSHAGGYAYDMIAALGNPILAARAGRVVQIQESLGDLCGIGGGCNPNNVFIRHQDGSIGEYAHMPLFSVLPEVGDLVLRGEQIAVVGLVGPTTGPHLHFATRTEPKPGGTTFLAKFEALVFDGSQLQLTGCYVPQQGATLVSNNKSVP